MELPECRNNLADLRVIGIHPGFWHPVALARELKRGATLAVSFAGEPIALARTETGSVMALEDRCAHRQVPLHLGMVQGEQLKCCYHGWCYDSKGKLTRIPYLADGGKLPPEARGVASYPCREAYGLIFIFPGAPESADRVPLPEVREFSSAEYRTMYFSREVKCHYSFMHENLMDMNHQFLHRRLMGSIRPVLIDYSAGDTWVEARYKFEGGKQHAGADLLLAGGKDETGAVERDYELMTIRTDYPHQGLTVYRAHSEIPALRLWASYVPLDAEQRRNRSFGLLMIRRPKIPGLLALAWPVIRYFAESVFSQDRLAVEQEQNAYDAQGADWNREISPVLLDLRRVLGTNGIAAAGLARGRAREARPIEKRRGV